ncbi:hypothetical protein Tco_0231913, partial [Tanacetum coccineum]
METILVLGYSFKFNIPKSSKEVRKRHPTKSNNRFSVLTSIDPGLNEKLEEGIVEDIGDDGYEVASEKGDTATFMADTTENLTLENMNTQLARKISSWWNVDYVDVSSYEEWYTWLVSLRLQANLKAVFEGIFYCLWWSVWMFRNKILFEKDTPSQAKIFDNIYLVTGKEADMTWRYLLRSARICNTLKNGLKRK